MCVHSTSIGEVLAHPLHQVAEAAVSQLICRYNAEHLVFQVFWCPWTKVMYSRAKTKKKKKKGFSLCCSLSPSSVLRWNRRQYPTLDHFNYVSKQHSLRLSFQRKQLLEHGCFENVVKFNLELVSKQGTSEILMLVISTAIFRGKYGSRAASLFFLVS